MNKWQNSFKNCYDYHFSKNQLHKMVIFEKTVLNLNISSKNANI